MESNEIIEQYHKNKMIPQPGVLPQMCYRNAHHRNQGSLAQHHDGNLYLEENVNPELLYMETPDQFYLTHRHRYCERCGIPIRHEVNKCVGCAYKLLMKEDDNNLGT